MVCLIKIGKKEFAIIRFNVELESHSKHKQRRQI